MKNTLDDDEKGVADENRLPTTRRRSRTRSTRRSTGSTRTRKPTRTSTRPSRRRSRRSRTRSCARLCCTRAPAARAAARRRNTRRLRTTTRRACPADKLSAGAGLGESVRGARDRSTRVTQLTSRGVEGKNRTRRVLTCGAQGRRRARVHYASVASSRADHAAGLAGARPPRRSPSRRRPSCATRRVAQDVPHAARAAVPGAGCCPRP